VDKAAESAGNKRQTRRHRQKVRRIGRSLDDIGISVIQVPDNKDVDPYLAGHADLSLFHMGDTAR
jgi:hypothetical protein